MVWGKRDAAAHLEVGADGAGVDEGDVDGALGLGERGQRLRVASFGSGLGLFRAADARNAGRVPTSCRPPAPPPHTAHTLRWTPRIPPTHTCNSARPPPTLMALTMSVAM